MDYYEIIRNCIRGTGSGPIVYLAGPMESVEHAGADWRTIYEEKLIAAGFRCISPNRLEQYVTTHFNVNYAAIQELKKSDLNAFRTQFRHVVQLDTTAVKYSDCVLIRFNNEKSSGTHGEVTYAYVNAIPSFLVTSQPPADILSWILACPEGVYSDEDQAIAAIKDYWYLG